MRGFSVFLVCLGFLAITASGQSADTTPSPDNQPPANEQPDSKSEAPADRQSEDDLDDFFDEADEQLDENGQSCSPPPEPIA